MTISPFCGAYNRKPKLRKTKALVPAFLWTGEVFPHQPDSKGPASPGCQPAQGCKSKVCSGGREYREAVARAGTETSR